MARGIPESDGPAGGYDFPYPSLLAFKDSAFTESNALFSESSVANYENPDSEKANGAAKKGWDWILEEVVFALENGRGEDALWLVEVPNPDYNLAYTRDVDMRPQ